MDHPIPTRSPDKGIIEKKKKKRKRKNDTSRIVDFSVPAEICCHLDSRERQLLNLERKTRKEEING